jgi:pantoate--beta-alanine ligase
VIHQSLSQAIAALYDGDTDHTALERAGSLMLERAAMRVDYFAIRNAADLSEPSAATSDLVVLTAVRLGRARLIDNLRIHRP